MQALTANVFVDTGRRGANHGFVMTSDGIVLIDTPQKPSDALRLRAEIERRGRLRYIINTEPHGDHWTGNAYFNVPVIAHVGVRNRILEMSMPEHIARVGAMGPEEPDLLDGYVPNAPVITFDETMTLHVGNHTIRLIHMPGHTAFQAAIVIEEEGIVFTSDNVFCGVQSWIQEGNPDQWYQALDSLRALSEDVLVPGHGPVCDKRAIDEQEAFIREWTAYVRGGIERGMTRDECVEQLTRMIDRFPMDVELESAAPRLMQLNAANLYDFLTGAGIHQRS